MLIEWVSITCIRKNYNTCEKSRVCNNRCLPLKRKRDNVWLCLSYFDFEFGDGFNTNFFDRDRRFYSKNWIFRIIEIRKIGNIFTLNDSQKDRDWQSDSKNLVVSKNRRSNHRGLTVVVLFILPWTFFTTLQAVYTIFFSKSLRHEKLFFHSFNMAKPATFFPIFPVNKQPSTLRWSAVVGAFMKGVIWFGYFQYWGFWTNCTFSRSICKVFSNCYNKQGIQSNLPSYRPVNQGTICAKVYPDGQPIKENNCGLIL